MHLQIQDGMKASTKANCVGWFKHCQTYIDRLDTHQMVWVTPLCMQMLKVKVKINKCIMWKLIKAHFNNEKENIYRPTWPAWSWNWIQNPAFVSQMWYKLCYIVNCIYLMLDTFKSSVFKGIWNAMKWQMTVSVAIIQVTRIFAGIKAVMLWYKCEAVCQPVKPTQSMDTG